jgi:hypothetical protein
VDKIFGKGTGPGEVASYLAHALAPASAKAAAPPGLTSDEGARREGGASKRPEHELNSTAGAGGSGGR